MKNKTLIIISVIIILLIGVGTYYYLFMYKPGDTTPGTGTGTGTNPTFNPFGGDSGGGNSTSTPRATSTPFVFASTTNPNIPKLRLISADPVAGAVASTTGSSTIIRYIDRGLGNIMETKVTGTDVTRISDKTLSQIYEAFWSKKAQSLVIRNLDENDENTVNTELLSIIDPKPIKVGTTTVLATSTIKAVRTSYIPTGVVAVANSPKDVKNESFAFLVKTNPGVKGFIQDTVTGNVVEVFSSPLESWNLFWPNQNTLIFSSKASSISVGSAYTYDIKKAEMTKIVSGTGLTVLPNGDMSEIAFSTTAPGGILTLSIYKTKEKTIENTVLKTLTEKCAWGTVENKTIYCAVPNNIPNGIYPDDWYKGLVFPGDRVWKYDTETGEVTMIGDLYSLSGKAIDAYNISIDPKDGYLIFMNKRDLSLWSLEIK
ncbi:MAG: hypothetical protein NTV72_00270 [Candidatus Taylorbacteria bacterium]|nr:hypothetical protein [Candidatus Taylorbacteria bacterium]